MSIVSCLIKLLYFILFWDILNFNDILVVYKKNNTKTDSKILIKLVVGPNSDISNPVFQWAKP